MGLRAELRVEGRFMIRKASQKTNILRVYSQVKIPTKNISSYIVFSYTLYML